VGGQLDSEVVPFRIPSAVSNSRDYEGPQREVDKHSESIALNRYCCQSPRRDAEFCLCLYKSIFGEPVAWPSHGEFQVRAASIQHLVDAHQAFEDADVANAQLVPYEPTSDEDDLVELCFALGRTSFSDN
jgi:hypothetical protein